MRARGTGRLNAGSNLMSHSDQKPKCYVMPKYCVSITWRPSREPANPIYE